MADRAQAAINKGSLRAIYDDDRSRMIDQPILQCVQIKPMGQGEGQNERYRIVFSDVNNFIQGMLALQSNHYILDGALQKGSIVRLKSFQANMVKAKKILIILDLDVLTEYGVHEKFGAPVALEGEQPRTNGDGDSKPQPGAISGTNFYGNQPKPQPQQQKQLPSRSNAPSHDSNIGHIMKIEGLSPYGQKWAIKARCTHKSAIKTWHKASGEGKLFSANFMDDTGEIRATAFKEQCDDFYDLIQEGQVYYIESPCKVQIAKKQFSNVNHDYELVFERDTKVHKVEDGDTSVPKMRFNFTGIGDLQSVEKDTLIDTIGVLKEVGEVSQITSKTTSKPYDKRELTLVDNSGYQVRLTIWGDQATKFDAPLDSVVAFKGAKVSDFGGRSLSLTSSGSMSIDPDIDEAYKLKGWYDAHGKQEDFASHATAAATAGTAGGRKMDYKTISQVLDEHIGMSDDAQYFTLKATIIYIKDQNVYYPSCRKEGCNKKVIEIDEGQWRCEQDEMTFEKPLWRYVLSVNVSDHTGQIWLSCFNEVGAQIMRMSADELHELKENDPGAATEAFANANCQSFVFRCRAKMDSFNDVQRVRYNVFSANPLNFPAESQRLATIIKSYSDDNSNDNSLFVR